MILEFMCVVRFQMINFLFFYQHNIFILDAENPMNRTTTSVYLDINHSNQPLTKNLTCSSSKYCHNRGQCIIINNQLKCL
jgi:hypothetical protein